MAISMLKIRRPLGRLIFNMGIAIPGKTVFLIETAPVVHNVYASGLLYFDMIRYRLVLPRSWSTLAEALACCLTAPMLTFHRQGPLTYVFRNPLVGISLGKSPTNVGKITSANMSYCNRAEAESIMAANDWHWHGYVMLWHFYSLGGLF